MKKITDYEYHEIEPWYFQAENEEQAQLLLDWIKENWDSNYYCKYAIIDSGFSFPSNDDPNLYSVGYHLDNDRGLTPLTYQQLLEKLNKNFGSQYEIY